MIDALANASPNVIRICNWDLQLECNWNATAGNCTQEYATGKTHAMVVLVNRSVAVYHWQLFGALCCRVLVNEGWALHCLHWLKGHVRPMSSSPSSSSSDDEAAPEPARPDWQTEEDGSARRMVFLVTFAAVLAETAAAEPPLRTLDGLTRADIQAAIADAVANPQAESRGRPRVASLQVQRMVVVLEQPFHFEAQRRHPLLPIGVPVTRNGGALCGIVFSPQSTSPRSIQSH